MNFYVGSGVASAVVWQTSKVLDCLSILTESGTTHSLCRELTFIAVYVIVTFDVQNPIYLNEATRPIQYHTTQYIQ